MDKILYDDVYPIVDDELIYSNIGGRKGRYIRDHLFIIYAVINDVMNGSSPDVDVQTMDIYKCFDEMWYQDTHNDMFDVKVQDDKFSLIAKMDENAQILGEQDNYARKCFWTHKVNYFHRYTGKRLPKF